MTTSLPRNSSVFSCTPEELNLVLCAAPFTAAARLSKPISAETWCACESRTHFACSRNKKQDFETCTAALSTSSWNGIEPTRAEFYL